MHHLVIPPDADLHDLIHFIRDDVDFSMLGIAIARSRLISTTPQFRLQSQSSGVTREAQRPTLRCQELTTLVV